eukprot:CAMPEP_0181251044 /NCGR_PEP_ID=MMETSP1096-20121128/46655_1 /TAXON_ID=156174 ORGANISM="Chrysochromulina ericina, Strain CCMP281" /NCGR_SAMPLE_ID=MMETSP1096 /ASSEMBLY_ACC=CAM_ASM_000453 /LENGTH=137 /DNA_ID=CAMNT_0023348577 /DNA_START=357 /DNA_END=768 /DNA_ORIENTATION=-
MLWGRKHAVGKKAVREVMRAPRELLQIDATARVPPDRGYGIEQKSDIRARVGHQREHEWWAARVQHDRILVDGGDEAVLSESELRRNALGRLSIGRCHPLQAAVVLELARSKEHHSLMVCHDSGLQWNVAQRLEGCL